MRVIEARLRDNYPTIQMTIVSLIVALVYENLVQAIRLESELWAGTPQGFLLWSQCIFLVNAPAMFWLKLSVDCSTMRVHFSPLDGLLSLLSGFVFLLMASAIGVANVLVWISAASAMHIMAWFYWRYQDRRYAQDPDAVRAAGTHRLGGRINLMSGCGLAVAAGLVHIDALGAFGAGLTLLAAAVFMDLAHFLWYRAWKQALDLGEL